MENKRCSNCLTMVNKGSLYQLNLGNSLVEYIDGLGLFYVEKAHMCIMYVWLIFKAAYRIQEMLSGLHLENLLMPATTCWSNGHNFKTDTVSVRFSK
jgi:hypothetical protein